LRSFDIYRLVKRHNRSRARQRRSFDQQLGRGSLGCGALLSLFLAAGILFGSIAYAQLTDKLPSLDLIPALLDEHKGLLLTPTRLYDNSGQHILYEIENPGIKRRYIPVNPDAAEHISAQLIQATIALEDPGFWDEPGFSFKNLTSSKPVTLAERLVDELLLANEPQGITRAIRLHILSAQLVARYSRTQILEWYLNSASYGHMAYGTESAAQLYFGKPTSQINLAEAAMLVAVQEAPALNPLDAPIAARERQQDVLDRLLEAGAISQADFKAAQSYKLKLQPVKTAPIQTATAFTHLVLDQLGEQFGQDRLARGGLRVITTLDYDLQQELTCSARTQLKRLQGKSSEVTLPGGKPCEAARLLPTLPSDNTPLPASLLASALILDPKNGQVLAMLGDSDTSKEKTGSIKHQPGSLLTPFVAVAGFARGLSPASLVWDIPSSLPEGLQEHPNPDGKFHGPERLRIAIANDYLAPISQILEQVGVMNVWRLAEPMGLTSLSAADKPQELLYDGGNTSLLQIAQAYSTFDNLGEQTGFKSQETENLSPATVISVEDLNGRKLLENGQPEKQAVLSQQLAYLVHHVLRDETARWPSLGYPNTLEIGRPSAAKIGEVEGKQEVWAVGYTPQRLAVFWLGLPDNSDETLTIDPKAAAGAWHALMQYANRDLSAEDWTAPAGITTVDVCDPSGMLPTQDCPTVVSEVFLNGNEPTRPDTLYRVFQINRETGKLATVFTPLSMIEERNFMVVPPEAQAWAHSAGLAVAPTDYDAIQPPQSQPDVQITDPPLFGYVHGKVALQGTAAGDNFKSFRVQVGEGLNPRNWLQVGNESSQPVKDGLLATWDTQGLDGLYAIRLFVVRENQQIDNATIQVTVDNTAPQVKITYPGPNQEVKAPGDQTITLSADASDTVGLSKIEWILDGQKIGENQQAPYNLAWKADSGTHTLVVRAYDLAGNQGDSPEVKFTIK
jgi:membrane peptidoglycan carboxypeptidase